MRRIWNTLKTLIKWFIYDGKLRCQGCEKRCEIESDWLGDKWPDDCNKNKIKR